ncbi:MAG: RsmE family RNA methyltransferase [Planctomycetota bacterium]
MTRRYFARDLISQRAPITLDRDESAHAIRVMRLEIGDAIDLFDGLGNEATGKVIDLSRDRCVCQMEPPVAVDREPTRSLTLAISLPKPDRAKEMVARLTELGVIRVVPIVTERTQRAPSTALLSKLERGVTEACKQSGRNRLMSIDEPRPLERLLADCSDTPSASRWVAAPGRQLFGSDRVQAQRVWTIVGPEGGLNEREMTACEDAGWEPISLGRRILRIETAAVAVAARVLTD